jgi:two-component system NtrC family sensor kinase
MAEPPAARLALSSSPPVGLPGLVQSGRLAAAGELAAGAVHEINNPLFAILTLTGFLLRDAERGTKAYERLELIEESAGHIRDVVERLHRFLRERPDWGVVALEDVARDAVDLVRHTSPSRRNDVVERYPEAHVFVEGSGAELKQALVNLLTNALQAMPGGGAATLEITREGRWAVAAVADEGEGIPPEELPRLFDAFYTTRDGSGSGLGLPVTRAIAELHGGSLTVDTTVERGARLVLRLPALETA